MLVYEDFESGDEEYIYCEKHNYGPIDVWYDCQCCVDEQAERERKERLRLRWEAIRLYWRARWIGVYWHQLTAKHMASGGKAQKRDRATYEDESFAF